MTPRYRTLSGQEIAKILIKHFDFKKVRQKGSHIILAKQNGRKVGTVIPNHKEVARGTLRGVLRLAAVDEEKFFRHF